MFLKSINKTNTKIVGLLYYACDLELYNLILLNNSEINTKLCTGVFKNSCI